MSRNILKRVLVCPDKFKYSLTARQICDIVSQELPDSHYLVKGIPLADGGEGSLDAIQETLSLSTVQVNVHDPLFRKIRAHYLFNQQSRIAYIEMAKASGLGLLSKEQRNPLNTSTFGTGQLLRHALIDNNAVKIYLFIGGSATNDAGIGMAAALGGKFKDRRGFSVDPVGGNLGKISDIHVGQLNELVSGRQIIIASDVKNKLIGSQGAAQIFGRQKGADDSMVATLQTNMVQFSKVLQSLLGWRVDGREGSGAAGGLGAGSIAFLNARMQGGIDTVMDILSFKQHFTECDTVVTGEGKLDRQTLSGKVVSGVVSMLQQSGNTKKCVVFCGKSELPGNVFGLNTEIVPLMQPGMDEQFSIANGESLLRKAIKSSVFLSCHRSEL